MISYYIILFLLCNSLRCVKGLKEPVCRDIAEIGFVILSQPNEYHNNLAEQLKQNILDQVLKLGCKEEINIYKSHEDFGDILGHWTVIPLFKKLSEFKNLKWIFFLEDQTHVNVQKMVKTMSSYNSSQDIFAGHALRDLNPTIIHHFATTDGDSVILYPHFSTGFFISFSLIMKLTGKCKDCLFSIDPKYELAKFIWENSNIKIIHELHLCLRKNTDACATWITGEFPECGPSISPKQIFVAVKTCKKFHKDRVKVLKTTWGPEVENLLLFSDAEDQSIPTMQLNVKNVDVGHCEKTLSIIKLFVSSDISFDWLTIVDDDTLLSFPRLIKLLSCYNSTDDVVIGERYGYSISNSFGYNYPTGGSGMIFSRPSLEKLITHCQCPSIDSPDDMIIGVCLKTLNIPLTHSPFFHQARPTDYSPLFLAPIKHISFHKHWMIDPYAVYEEWLQDNHIAKIKHSEL
ncbi:beta-1,3-glucosyltransferase [Trichonephila clavata]|uniref:Beta-1,3-glucosyltransferase n=1 Tax=Trichonephila clavata TaxID=2740835 RepID=A0A8X6G940_TRICU|nr:beta-1,3-glucosyltransferase [Trichonephila clavata]